LEQFYFLRKINAIPVHLNFLKLAFIFYFSELAKRKESMLEFRYGIEWQSL